ncbi:hypothetical protein HRI_001578800 [Hibiscus trionum]|uniref:Reverse transcriptase domain-containing protein n=1 Tax=Hibiscus trionum TaxID=183268 RepID=A0A9W7HJV9_HIBTR|nr:hypothetical protein HRI_001578800 [Hibiscus trionum]
MKILSWNVRGLGQPRTVGRLSQKIRDENPSIIFLIETKLSAGRMEKVRKRCGFNNGIDVEAIGRSGGLSMGWKSTCDVTLRSYSVRHIDVEIKDEDTGSTWRCTGFYGNPETSRRMESWNLLRSLDDSPDMPWLVIGDFNEILFAGEKQGGLLRNQRQMDLFRSALEDCALDDLGYSGSWFTWEKGRSEQSNMRIRLDRGVANNIWWSLFPNFTLQHLQHSFSDHCPLLLNTTPNGNGGNRVWHFMFEASWLLEESCETTVADIWHDSGDDLLGKLSMVSKGLDTWFRKIRREKNLSVNDLNKKLADLNDLQPTDDILGDIVETKLALNLELDRKELYWEQRARSNWLKHGDRNTSYFHRSATQRRKKNKVLKLFTTNNVEVTNEEEMGQIAREYFISLFTSQGGGDNAKILEGISKVITDEMNGFLRREYTQEEVFSALKSMSPLKAAGEDGLGALFYRRFWHIVGNDVSAFCIRALKGEIPLDSINHTRIVLIPKVNEPTIMAHFRPISLCNVLYKLISKVLVTRLQSVMPLCIDEAQSAFVPGRLSTDNIMAAFEIIHSLRSKRHGKKSFLALKLDMSKAYDRVEWGFLESLLLKMGFDSDWVSIIINCISSVSYSVVLNGSVGNRFSPSRGLRQGDPLSPFLFLVCSEGLSSLLRQASCGVGVRIARGAPNISHLFFADDSLIFGEASSRGASTIREILGIYERCSGQVVNLEKSGVFFSGNTTDREKDEVKRILGINQGFSSEKFLGLPILVGRNRKQVFMDLRDKMLAWILNWATRLLSQ